MSLRSKWIVLIKSLVIVSLFPLVNGCIEPLDQEIEQPSLELLSPGPCDTLYFGEEFSFVARIMDNTGLGNISMDIHHNFGHHDHGAHESCSLDPQKNAINPYSESWILSLPDTSTNYLLEKEIAFPDGHQGVYYDTGDYHFHFYVTDIDGYQVFTTMDLKVLKK